MSGIDGLLYIPQFLSPDECDHLVSIIDKQPWRPDLSRRTQRYGYVYQHKRGVLDTDGFLGPLPDWLQSLCSRLPPDITGGHFDQAIINEYEPGQGIGRHIDDPIAFGPVVVSVSLLSAANLEFTRDSFETVSQRLETGSALILVGDARYRWRHGMTARRTDIVDRQQIARQRRVSVTFRSVTGGARPARADTMPTD